MGIPLFSIKSLTENGGGGGGGGLPPVTGSGKALVSVNGQWVEQDGYGWIEIVHGSVSAQTFEQGYAPDKWYLYESGYAFSANESVHVKIDSYGSVLFDDDVTLNYQGFDFTALSASVGNYKLVQQSSANNLIFDLNGQPNPYATVTVSKEGLYKNVYHTFDKKLIPKELPPPDTDNWILISDAINGIWTVMYFPPHTFEDAGKVLGIDGSGTLAWMEGRKNYDVVGSLSGWNQTLRLGSATPNITLPTPSLQVEEEIRITFTAATANATFTAPSGFILGDDNGYAGLSAGNSIAYTDLTVGSIYEVSIAVLDSTYLQLSKKEMVV